MTVTGAKQFGVKRRDNEARLLFESLSEGQIEYQLWWSYTSSVSR